MFMTKSDKPLVAAGVKNLFEDSSDESLDEHSHQIKYQQINKNLQGVIAFCANKMGSSHSREEAPKKALADRGGCKEAFSDTLVKGDAGNTPNQWGYHDSRLYQEKVPLRAGNSGGQGTLRVTKNMFGSDDPTASEHNLKEFQTLIRNFILANNCGSESSRIPPSRRPQTRRVNEFKLTTDENNKIVQRQLRPSELQPGGSFETPLRSNYRNLSSSPFMPLKCAKCQLEVSKRELETIGRKLKQMQGYHDCSDFVCGCHSCDGTKTVARHFCGGDESAKEWDCTCAHIPGSRNKELHKQEKRDSNMSLISNRFTSFSGGSDSFQLCPNPNAFACGCCHAEKMLQHSCVPNFIQHDDTHGKCRDCYRQEMLHDAFKLKHIIDMQYERQRARESYLHRQHHKDGPQDFANGFSSRPAINERSYGERENSTWRYTDSNPALVVELNRSSSSLLTKKSDITTVVDENIVVSTSTSTQTMD